MAMHFCEVKKKQANVTYFLYDSVEKLPISEWNQVIESTSFYMHSDYLVALERSSTDGLKFYYVIAYSEKKPVAAYYFQYISISGNVLMPAISSFCNKITSEHVKKKVTQIIQNKIEKTSLTILVNGNLFSSGMHGYCTTEMKEAQFYLDSIDLIVKKLKKEQKELLKTSFILLKDFSSDSLKEYKPLIKKSYSSFLSEPMMMLDLQPQWLIFEDYLQALSKKYRKRANTIQLSGAKLIRKEFDLKELKQYNESVYTLYKTVASAASFNVALLPENYFLEMKKAMPDVFRVHGYFIDQKLVAFRSSFLVRQENQLEAHFIGFDYSLNKDLESYQNILYDFIDEGIKKGVSRINYGRTAMEIKSNLGAKAQDLTLFMQHTNSIYNFLAKQFVKQLKPTKWTPRDPFKKTGVAL